MPSGVEQQAVIVLFAKLQLAATPGIGADEMHREIRSWWRRRHRPAGRSWRTRDRGAPPADSLVPVQQVRNAARASSRAGGAISSGEWQIEANDPRRASGAHARQQPSTTAAIGSTSRSATNRNTDKVGAWPSTSPGATTEQGPAGKGAARGEERRAMPHGAQGKSRKKRSCRAASMRLA